MMIRYNPKKAKIYIAAILVNILLCEVSYSFYLLESLVLGDVSDRFQEKITYSPSLSKSSLSQNELNAQALVDSCIGMKRTPIKTIQEGRENVLNIIGTIQYGSLNALSKNIVFLSKRLKLKKNEFSYLTDNIVTNYCSENLTVISKKNLKNNLNFIFDNIEMNEETGVSPYNEELVSITDLDLYYSNQLNGAIGAFKSICSWGGTADDLGLLNPFLRSPHIFSMMLNSNITEEPFFKTVQCENLICRKKDLAPIEEVKFLATSKEYFCHKFSKISKRPSPQSTTLQKWNEQTTGDDYTFQVSQLFSAISRTPNLLAVARGDNNEKILSSGFDHYFQLWSKNKVDYFKTNIRFEELMNLRLLSKVIDSRENSIEFQIDFGEIDKSVDRVGKPKTYFYFYLSEKLINFIRNKSFYDTDFSLKKEKHLIKVIKEHLVEDAHKVYQNYFSFFDKEYFFDQVATAIYDGITTSKKIKIVDKPFKAQFYFSHFALEELRKLRRVKN